MKLKEITIRKASRETTKDSQGSYSMREGDVTLVVTADSDEGLTIKQVEDTIAEVKRLTTLTRDDEPNWLTKGTQDSLLSEGGVKDAVK